MNTSFFAATFLAAGLLAASTGSGQAARAAENPVSAAGHWEGKLQMDPAHELDMTLDLATSPKGGWIGTLTFPKSTSKDMPLEQIKVEGNKVEFAAHAPGPAHFSALLGSDRNSLEGTAANDQGEAPFQLKRNGDANVNLPPPSSPLAKEFAGTWTGELMVNGNARALTVKLTPDSAGLGTGTITVEQPRHMELLITTVTITGKELNFELRAITGSFVGKLGDNGEIAGEWAQGPGKLPLTLKRAETAKP